MATICSWVTRNSDSMVILADDRSMLLQSLGDPDFLSRADRVVPMPGARNT